MLRSSVLVEVLVPYLARAPEKCGESGAVVPLATMDDSFKYSEDAEDEEVSGILRQNYASNTDDGQYYDVLSRFGDLMTGSSGSLDSSGGFTSFVTSGGQQLAGEHENKAQGAPHIGQQTDATWSRSTTGAGAGHSVHGPRYVQLQVVMCDQAELVLSPPNAFKFGLSGLSIPTIGQGPGYAAPSADERAAWYENLPQGERQEQAGGSPELSPGVPLDLEFLSSNGEASPQQSSYGFTQSNVPMRSVNTSSGANLKPGLGGAQGALSASKSPQHARPQFIGPYYQTNSAQPPQHMSQPHFYASGAGYPQQAFSQTEERFQNTYGMMPPPAVQHKQHALGAKGFVAQPPGYEGINSQRNQQGGMQRFEQTQYKKPEQAASVSPRRVDNRSNGRRGGEGVKKAARNDSNTTGPVASGSKTDAQSAAENQKRAELVESPTTRLKFKDFYRQFRAREKESFEEAYAYAQEGLETLPKKIHWRVYLEMADLAKRENKFSDARQLYKTVNKLQPYAPQGWLEYSKMEEECGRLYHCQKILHEGLKYCNFSESLLTKAIKHEERMGNLTAARGLLGRLRTQSVEKAWRTILEGALLEARAGNVVVARKVFKYLMQNVPWYGPIYFEAARFEEKNEEFQRAIKIVEKGKPLVCSTQEIEGSLRY